MYVGCFSFNYTIIYYCRNTNVTYLPSGNINIGNLFLSSTWSFNLKVSQRQTRGSPGRGNILSIVAYNKFWFPTDLNPIDPGSFIGTQLNFHITMML